MSNYRGHLIGGAVAFSVAWYVLKCKNPTLMTSIEWLMCSLIGSLFPDVDIKSKGQKYFYTCLLFSFIMLFIQERLALLGCLSIISLAPLLTPHRGLFHHIGFVCALPVFIWALGTLANPDYKEILFYHMLFFTVGQISHLWLDFGTERLIGQICGMPKKTNRY